MSGIERIAMLASLAAACGSGRMTSTDAAVGIDSSAGPDAGPSVGIVTVTALDPEGNGLPLRGSHVFFNGPDGKLISDVIVDDTGKATAEIAPGSMVTAFWQVSSLDYRMETVLDVDPGDALVLSAFATDTRPAGTMHVSFAAEPSSTSYEIYSSRMQSSFVSRTSDDIAATPTQAAKPIDYFVVANGDTGPLGFLESDDVPFVDGQTLAINGPWRSFDQCTATCRDIPSGLVVGSSRHATTLLGIGTSLDTTDPQGSATMTFTGACAVTAARPMVTTYAVPDGPSQALQIIAESVSPNELTHETDVGALLLPWMDAPAFDMGTGEIKTLAHGAGTPDAFMVTATYQRQLAPLYSRFYSWTVIGPRIQDVKLPDVPATLAILPRPSDAFGTAQATVFEWDAIADYAAFKAHLEPLISAPISTDVNDPINRRSISDLGH